MSESVAWAAEAHARIVAGARPETPEQRVIREAEEQRTSDNIRMRRRLPRVA